MRLTLVPAILISALLGSGTAIYHIGRRDVQQGTAVKVFDLVFETLKTAKNGILSSEIASSARTIINETDAVVGDVSAEDVDDIIQEIASSISSSSIVSSLFDVINDALALWRRLAERGRELVESNDPVGHVLVAISRTAKVIDAAVKDIVEVVNYDNQNKRVVGEPNKDVLLILEEDNNTKEINVGKSEKRFLRVCPGPLVWNPLNRNCLPWRGK